MAKQEKKEKKSYSLKSGAIYNPVKKKLVSKEDFTDEDRDQILSSFKGEEKEAKDKRYFQ